jgi:hypothetical protein
MNFPITSDLFKNNKLTPSLQALQALDDFNFDIDIPYIPMKMELNPKEPPKKKRIINPHKLDTVSIKKQKREELEKLRKSLDKLQKLFFNLEEEIEKL